jgi:hypothetical protein
MVGKRLATPSCHTPDFAALFRVCRGYWGAQCTGQPAATSAYKTEVCLPIGSIFAVLNCTGGKLPAQPLEWLIA